MSESLMTEKSIQESFERNDGSHIEKLNQLFEKYGNNIYSEVLRLITQLSHSQQKQSGIKSSIPYIVVQQLDQFIKSSSNRRQYEHKLTHSLRMNALNFALKKKNKSWIDIVFDVFHLETMDSNDILVIVDNLLAQNKFFDASLLVVKFELRNRFDIKQILVPLLLQVFGSIFGSIN
jgi:hypothetical protein